MEARDGVWEFCIAGAGGKRVLREHLGLASGMGRVLALVSFVMFRATNCFSFVLRIQRCFLGVYHLRVLQFAMY